MAMFLHVPCGLALVGRRLLDFYGRIILSCSSHHDPSMVLSWSSFFRRVVRCRPSR